MVENPDYLRLIAQKYLRHKDNFKDNPSRYTSLFNIIVPILNPNQRKEFNKELKRFSENHYGLRPEGAEKICFDYYDKFHLRGKRIFKNIREENKSFDFDTPDRVEIDIVKLERGLRNLCQWLQIKFKQISKERGLSFDKDEFGISDIQHGTSSVL